jgi:beta-aspartyl-dipeptidase (metallo-type)
VRTTLLHGGKVVGPDGLLPADVVLAGRDVVEVSPNGATSSALREMASVDCTDHYVTAGLVDGHVHILGGGGGSGYGSRIPELPADAILRAGTTTCVGMPGVDIVSKPIETMLARAYAMDRDGPRTRAMTGGFHWPAESLTGSLVRDLYLLPHLVGVKVALFERTATAPDHDELVVLLRQLQWAAAATGKGCLLHVHLGTQPGTRLDLLRALEASGADPQRLQVTHVNYCPDNLDAAAVLGVSGCWVDINPLIHPGRIAGSIDPVDSVRRLLEAGVPAERITLSSDGNASVPRTLPDSTTETFQYRLELLPTVRAIVSAGVLPIHAALALATRNPARALRLERVGVLEPGSAADVLVLDSRLSVRDVWSAGRTMVRDGRVLNPSPYQHPAGDLL